MELKDATRMILAQSAPHPELLRLARHAHEESSAGRTPSHTVLSGMLREAARKDVFPVLMERHGRDAFDDMVVVLGREIDRQAPVPARHH